tara:strand:- start:764 stop:1765 length:1002 start_codon:yes stop_codon:yes gene_type:complete
LKIKTSNYFILKNTSDLIDQRSKRFSGLKKENLSKSINFVRSTSFTLSLKAFLTLKNIIVINSFHDLIFLKKNFFGKKSKLIQISFHQKFFEILKYLEIKKFRMIDDYRLMDLFLPICKKLNIHTEGYMHGRISENLDYQKNLKYFSFSKYYVWNKYFKKKILKINNNYTTNQIIIKNHLKNLKAKQKGNKKAILIIEEDNIDFIIYRKIISNLVLKNKYPIYFKFRPNNKININFKKFLINYKIKILHTENIYETFLNKNIIFLIGFNSSLLIECSYYNILPIMIRNRYNKIKDLISDNLFFIVNLNFLKKDLSKLKNIKKNIFKIRNKVWG